MVVQNKCKTGEYVQFVLLVAHTGNRVVSYKKERRRRPLRKKDFSGGYNNE